jgi:hypothetical protein
LILQVDGVPDSLVDLIRKRRFLAAPYIKSGPAARKPKTHALKLTGSVPLTLTRVYPS